METFMVLANRVYSRSKPMATSNYEPTVQVRCDACGMAHYDENFSVCRDCGASL